MTFNNFFDFQLKAMIICKHIARGNPRMWFTHTDDGLLYCFWLRFVQPLLQSTIKIFTYALRNSAPLSGGISMTHSLPRTSGANGLPCTLYAVIGYSHTSAWFG